MGKETSNPISGNCRWSNSQLRRFGFYSVGLLEVILNCIETNYGLCWVARMGKYLFRTNLITPIILGFLSFFKELTGG